MAAATAAPADGRPRPLGARRRHAAGAQAKPAWPWRDRVGLRFVEGRPVRACTIPVLPWGCDTLVTVDRRARLLTRDNAPWHGCQAVLRWLRRHNRSVNRPGAGVRRLGYVLARSRPWLNAIEPKWEYRQRRVADADSGR